MAGQTWRYDDKPGGRGMFADPDDEEQDPTAMPSAAPLTFASDAGGSASASPPASAAPPAPATGLPSGEVMGIPNTTTPLTLTGTHHEETTSVKEARDTELEGQVAKATVGQATAAEKIGELKGQEKATVAGVKGAQAQDYAGLLKEQNAADAELKGKLAAYDKETERLRKEDAAIPITDGWSNKSTGDKLAAGVALLMNGLARGLTGNHGPDEVFNAIRENIDKDHAEQLRRHEERLKRITNLESGPLRDQAMREGERQMDALKRKQAFMDGKVAAFIEQAAARTGSETAVVEGKQLADKLRAEGAEKEAGLREHYIKKVTTGGESKQVNPSGAQAVPPDLTVQDLAGNVIGKGRSLAEAEKVREAQGKANQLLGALGDLKAHVLANGRTDLAGVTLPGMTTQRAERENMIKSINGQLSALYAAGVLSEAEFKRQSAGLNTSVLKGGDETAAGIDVIAKDVERAYNAHVRSKAILAPGANPTNREAARAAPVPASAAPSASAPSSADRDAAAKWLASPDGAKASASKRDRIKATYGLP